MGDAAFDEAMNEGIAARLIEEYRSPDNAADAAADRGAERAAQMREIVRERLASFSLDDRRGALSGLRYPAESFLSARRKLSGNETKPGCEISAALEFSIAGAKASTASATSGPTPGIV